MLKKLTHYLKKKVSFMQASEQCKRIALFTFLSEQCTLYTVHVNCIVHWTVQLTWTVKKK
jgi:hypothetical protein